MVNGLDGIGADRAWATRSITKLACLAVLVKGGYMGFGVVQVARQTGTQIDALDLLKQEFPALSR